MGLLNREPEPEPDASRGAKLALVSVAAALVLAVGIWLAVRPRDPEGPTRPFSNSMLGVRFDYPAELLAGPNFVRTGDGAFLTIERHSLEDASAEWMAGLPEVLFPQVMIQLDQSYPVLEELSRRKGTLGGRPSLHVELRGRAVRTRHTTLIAVDVAATDDWVYVLRAYTPETTGSAGERAFDEVRRTFEFVPDGGTAGGGS